MDPKIIEMPEPEEVVGTGGMGNFFFEKMKSHGDAAAQLDPYTMETDSYSSLLQRCIRTAIVMRSRGIEPGHIVSICTHNHFNSSVPYFACLFLGALPACLEISFNLTDTTNLLRQVCPKIVFVCPEVFDLIEQALKITENNAEIVIFGESSGRTSFTEFLKPSPGEEEAFCPVEVDVTETALILFSSGTTGLAKGICAHHYGILNNVNQFVKDVAGAKMCLTFSMMFWISWVMMAVICILNGGCRIIVNAFDPEFTWDIITRLKVNLLFLGTAQAASMLRTLPQESELSHLMIVQIGGSSVAPTYIEQFRNYLPHVYVVIGYGLTEISGLAMKFSITNHDNIAMYRRKPGTVGQPMSGITYKVVDPETEELLGPNQPGELRLKSVYEMNGYYNLDTSVAYDSDGWLKTGDLVYYDEDRCFYVIERLKEVLKFRSWQIQPAILETILLSHPAITSAAVVGQSHPEDGDIPTAVVTVSPAFGDQIDLDEILEYVNGQVSDWQKLRGGIRVVEKLPVTGTGKIKRREVKKMI